MIYGLTCFFLRMMLRLLFSYKAYGLENIPKRGSFIIAPNHVSYLDPIAVGVFIPRKANYIAKKELFRNRYFGWYLRKLRTVPADRSGIKNIIKLIKRGYPIVIFPEGQRSNGHAFLEPETGVGYLALKFNLPVMPVYVKGSREALPKGARFIKPGPIRVYYGKPKLYHIPPGGDRNKAYKEVSSRVMDEIKGMKGRYGA